MKSKFILFRILLYLGGFAVFSFGTALSILSTLGVTAITSLPLALSVATGTSVGFMMMVMAVVYVLGQLVLQGRAFAPATAGQVGTGLMMGFFVDFMTRSLEGVVPASYTEKLLLAIIAPPVIALGLSMIINANFMPTPSEGFSLTLAHKLGKDFSKTKMMVDCATLLVAVLVFLLFTGSVVGIREGTVINALSIGLLIGMYNRRLAPLYARINGRAAPKRRGGSGQWQAARSTRHGSSDI